MNHPWTITLPVADAATLAGLRLTPGIEVAVDGAMLWLRSKTCDESLRQALRRLPALARYEWLSDNSLRVMQERIPSRSLPGLPWLALSQWLSPETAPAAYPGDVPRPVALRLERSFSEAAPDI